ncbi:MAG: tRNA 2-thiouridine(34) synthase MnmA [Acidimicrobiaceae bacterium]|nr:tRNA 2-thiouridine(34) synthase MnmA [Acidimicrobiaceae bacterium]
MKVMLAMSGGVDSSVAGALLLDAGHDVVGVTMKLWGGDSDTGCCSVSDVDDARRVAQQLDIDHLVFNFGDDFDRHVVDPYVRDHTLGVTPNPCIECNRHVKFDRLLTRADQLGFDAVATGHHARIGRTNDGRLTLERGADPAKDQSYVVHMLDQHALARTLFPVGSIDKAEVRRIAADRGLRTASKPDSQDVCFITSTGGRETFLGDRIEFRPGRVVDTSGVELGRVESVEMVTIGQRRGIGLPGGGPKRYVVDVDVPGTTVTVGDERDLLDDALTVGAVSWTDGPVHGDVLVQASAHGATQRATLSGASPVDVDVDDVDGAVNVDVVWHTPQRRIAPGQSVVFYDAADTRVLGGGIAR